ncbi:MAG: hypothetical protein ACJBCI_07375 [Candidatus Tisiphia sp.]
MLINISRPPLPYAYNIGYIKQFKINEEKIIDAYRSSTVKGSNSKYDL